MTHSDVPRPEYPRPQFVRDGWKNLNGRWEFLFDFGNSGMDRRLWEEENLSKALASSPLPTSITVPFCPESRLSGIGWTDWIATVWYRRRFTLDEQEQNGLYKYDRSRKFSDAVYDGIRAVNTETAAIERKGEAF